MRLTLAKASGRNWNIVDLDAVQMLGTVPIVDTLLFLAVHAAVVAVHPKIKVENLPDHYRGPLA